MASRRRNVLVGIYFMPYITSTVAIAILFGSLFSTDYGLINAALGAIRSLPGLEWLLPAEAIDWLNDPDRLKPAIATVVFWRYVGFNVVLYLAALQTIPKDLYEAATMDGAGRWQQFVYITLPGLKAMLLFGVTLSIIGSMQLFEEPFILTNGRGGNDQAGMTSAVYLYRWPLTSTTSAPPAPCRGCCSCFWAWPLGPRTAHSEKTSHERNPSTRSQHLGGSRPGGPGRADHVRALLRDVRVRHPRAHRDLQHAAASVVW
jgi:hypothetical protein